MQGSEKTWTWWLCKKTPIPLWESSAGLALALGLSGLPWVLQWQTSGLQPTGYFKGWHVWIGSSEAAPHTKLISIQVKSTAEYFLCNMILSNILSMLQTSTLPDLYLFMQSATKVSSSRPVYNLDAFFFIPEWVCKVGSGPRYQIL